jgi:hypothetical protein
MTGRSGVPPRVVRFYGNIDFALDTIAHKQAILIHASKLNDPFDPYFFFETDFNENYDRLLEYVRTKRPNDFGWFIQMVRPDSWQQSVDFVRKHTSDYKNNTFVFSCSAATKESDPSNNLYMWGHYGNGHRGIAIEFDTSKVSTLLTDTHNQQSSDEIIPEKVWIQIQYRKDIKPMTPQMFFELYESEYRRREERTSIHEYLDMASSVKSTVWRQEVEWRLLWRNNGTRLKIHRIPLLQDAITAIYLGLLTPEVSRDDILFETRRNFPGAKVFKARKKPGFSELEFVPVS